MKKSVIYFILILAVVGGLVAYIVSRNKAEEGKSPDTAQVQEDKKSGEEKTEKVEDKKPVKKEETKKQDTGDYSSFSSNKQEVGTFVEDDKFTLRSIEDTTKGGYHEFVFNLEGPSEPKVIARYDANANVIKVEIFNVEKDNSGIPYQGERSINKEGILRLYHNVSGSQEKSFYDIGLSQSTVFKLDSTSGSEDDTWTVLLYVKYPGEKEVEGNLGSSEFSKDDQSITGVGADKGASINSYAYTASGGVLKFTFGVSASGDNPIPMASAKYDGTEKLVLTFDSLKIDRAVKACEGISLPLGIALNTERNGDKSIYTFYVKDDAEFKLSASLSPNQIILEIK